MLTLVLMHLGGCGEESPQSLLTSAQQLTAKGDLKAAAIQYKVLLQRDPHSLEARILLAQVMLSAGDAPGAVIELSKAQADQAPPDRVLPLLSRALRMADELRKLTATYGDTDLADKSAQAELKVNVATAWALLGNAAKTEAATAAALAAVPDYPPARLLQARVLTGSGKLDEARSLVDKALAADDKLYEGWQLRADLLWASGGDLKQADAALLKSLALNPTHVPAYSSLIGLRMRQGDMAGAKEQIEKFRQVLPSHPLLLLFEGQMAYFEGDIPRAREIALRLLRFGTDHVPVLLFAGTAEAAAGSLVQAQSYFAKAVQLSPGLELARINLGQTQVSLGQYAKVMETLKPLLEADPPSAAALALVGDSMLRQDKPEAAEKYFLRAARLEPGNARLQTSAAVSRIWRGDDAPGLANLESLAANNKDTFADRALLAARLKRREYDQALNVLDGMLKKVPESKAANLEMRGRVELARRNLPAARLAFENATKADPASFAPVNYLASIDVQEGKPAQAAERLQAAVTANPRNPQALMALAQLKLRQGAPVEDVKKLLTDAVSASPTTAEPRLMLIDLLLRKRQYKDALAAAREATSVLPGDLAVLQAAAAAQVQGGDVEQAINSYRKLAASLPDSAQPLLQLASVYTASGQRPQAESTLKQALEVEPDNAAAQGALLDILVASGRESAALEYIKRLRQKHPEQPVPYLLEASYHLRNKKPDAALAVFKEGLAKTDSSALAVQLHKTLLQLSRTREADEWGVTWLRKHPNDPMFTYQLANTHLARNEFAAAEDQLKRVVDAVPHQYMALNSLAWVLVKLGKPGAVAYAERALTFVPDSPDVMDTLAAALASEKRWPAALDMQRRAVEASPNDNDLRLNLAKLAIQSGDKAVAKQELQRLQALGTAFAGQAEVTQLLQKL